MADPRAYVRAGNSEKSVNHKQTNNKQQQTISFETVTNVTSASPNSKLRIGWRPTLSTRIQNSESVGGRHRQPGFKTQNRLAAVSPDSKLYQHTVIFQF